MRGLGTTLLVLLLVLVGGFCAIDEVARRTAEQRLAGQLANRLEGTPTVQAEGWPFLATLATDRLSRLEVDLPAGRVAVGDHQVPVTDLHAVATGISHATDMPAARAAQLRAHAAVGYSSLSRAVDADVTPAGQGRMALRKSVEVAGFSADVVLEGRPTVQAGRLVLQEPSGTLNGSPMTPGQARLAASEASAAAELPTTAGLQVTGVEARDDGVVLQLTGSDVPVGQLV